MIIVIFIIQLQTYLRPEEKFLYLKKTIGWQINVIKASQCNSAQPAGDKNKRTLSITFEVIFVYEPDGRTFTERYSARSGT